MPSVVKKAIQTISKDTAKTIMYKVIDEADPEKVAFYWKGILYLNKYNIDIDDYEQTVSVAAHEIGHELFSPVFTEVRIVEMVIAQSVAVDEYQKNGFIMEVSGFTNLIDDQIVNASVVRYMPTAGKVFKEWLKKGAPLGKGREPSYVIKPDTHPCFAYHVEIMQKIANDKALPPSLEKLVAKGMGMPDIQDYYKNYKEYVEYYLAECLRRGVEWIYP